MPFQFSLAAVLTLRESIEQREFLALERIHQEIGQLKTKLQQIREARVAAIKNREKELSGGVPSVQLQGFYELDRTLEAQERGLESQLLEWEAKRERQLKVYQSAQQAREVLDEIRERQREAYRRAQEKREQKAVDDLFLARRKRAQ
jgi:flagellar export protein FliJ